MAYIDKNGVRQEGKPRKLTEQESAERSKQLFAHAKGKALKNYDPYSGTTYSHSRGKRYGRANSE